MVAQSGDIPLTETHRDSQHGRRARYFVLATVCLFVGFLSIGALAGGYQIAWNWLAGDEARRLRDALALYVSDLRQNLVAHRATPALIAQHPDVAKLLRNPGDTTTRRVNILLEATASAIDVSDLYVMDRQGLTLAASNWRRERTFVGKNFSYRPYYRDAIEGRAGQFFGLGTTSGRRGYYYSNPVRDGGSIIGAMVAKIEVQPLEKLWRGDGVLALTDEFGIVFLSSEPDLLYRALEPLEPEAEEILNQTQRYDTATIYPLENTRRPLSSKQATLIRFSKGSNPPATAHRDGEAIMVSVPLPELGGTVHVLAPLETVATRASLFTVLLGLALASLWLLGLAVQQRRRNILQRRAFEHQRAEQLETSARELERQVELRTRELSQSNQALHKTISERKSMEQSLRRTQAELIQAEKLAAIGKITAGINHELNQPIGAVRSYADNARKFLDRGQPDKAVENLLTIAELTERMGGIVTELKSLARRDVEKIESVSLADVLETALRTVQHRFDDLHVTLKGLNNIADLSVAARRVGLEQVLTNLLSNAADALAEASGERSLEIEVTETAYVAHLTIADTGPGIPDEALEQLFDPFFTTKSVGAGLGLGLAISRTIVETFGGTLSAENQSQGGALFTVTLALNSGSSSHTGGQQ